MINKAMIMSAGVGSRLDPLTRNVPKPLVPIANIPAMDILLGHLIKNGINKFVANTHYIAEQIHERYSNSDLDMHFEYVYEKDLSGTAGGVKKCQYFFNEGENFLVMSADGFTDVDITNAIKSHLESNCIATMVIKEVPKSEVFKFGVVVTDNDNKITEFQEKPSEEEAKSTLVNTGIYIFKYDIFNFIPENTVYDFAKNVFPSLMAADLKINTYTTKSYWSDIGSIEQYVTSTNDVFENKIDIDNIEIIETTNGLLISGNNNIIHEGAEFIGNSVIGNNCLISKNAKVKNSIIWDNVEIAEGIAVIDCVIASSAKIYSSISNKIIESNSIVLKETQHK